MLSQLKSLTKINPPVCVSKYLLATTVVLNIKRAWYSQCTDTASKLFRQLNSTDLLKVSTYVGSHCLGWVTKVWKQGQNSPETPELASCPGKRAWGPVAKSQRENTGWIRGSLMEEEGTTHPAVERGRPWCGRRKGSRQHALRVPSHSSGLSHCEQGRTRDTLTAASACLKNYLHYVQGDFLAEPFKL